MKIALLGSGVMGSAVLSSIAAEESVTEVSVTDVRGEVARRVAGEAEDRARSEGYAVSISGGTVGAAAVRDADLIVLAVKPQHMDTLLAQISPHLPGGSPVVSIAAGLPTAYFAQRLPVGTPVVRVMPNTPATIGQGVSAISAGEHATEEHLDLVEALFARTGLVVRVPESQQSVVTGVSGSGPAYVFAMIDALAEAGTAGGLPRALALQLAAHTVAGSGAYAVESGQHPALLREAVSSPGGTTLAGLGELDERAVRAAYLAAVRSAAARADELASQLAGPADDA
ncbi:pyrroline-5-carboxylate reductase [Serinibacter salmoneus]|uniref:Pyrroline-5-carboxylate reductase n=1 Tax=Serinibacter salmoneus TaxID=556530 RepID=A0A2A9D2H7_9MICO|nr:pyrroline-5-carboxylate reductase [Serinibacter salmoneus]PFG20536.1 pyrroline-5-carboxylate reductase [Serinibacter salmoneus]